MKTLLQALLALTLPGLLVSILLEHGLPPVPEPEVYARSQTPAREMREVEKRARAPVRSVRRNEAAVATSQRADPAEPEPRRLESPAEAIRTSASNPRAEWEYGSKTDRTGDARSIWIMNESAPFEMRGSRDQAAFLGIGCLEGNAAVWLDVGSEIGPGSVEAGRVQVRLDRSRVFAWNASPIASGTALTLDAPIPLLREMVTSRSVSIEFALATGDTPTAEFDLSKLPEEIRPIQELCSLR